MADDVKTLLARLKFAVDQGDLEKSKKALGDYDAAMKKIHSSTDEATKRLQKMREQAEKLQQVGMQLGVAGAAILAPFLLASRQYVQEYGKSEETSRRWISATEKLNQAQIRIGRETTKVLAPLFEMGADLADKFATFIEKNPDVLKAILTVGAGLAGAGTVVTLIAQAQKLITAVQLMTGAKAVVGAGGIPAISGSGIMAILVPLLPAILAAIAAFLVLNNVTLPGDKQAMLPTAGKVLAQGDTAMAYFIGNLIGGPELAAKWGKSIGELTGAIEKADDATGKTTDKFSEFTDEQLKAYLDYQKADQDATQALQKKKADLVSSANQANLEAEKAYQKQRSDLVSNAAEQTQRELEDFNRKRSQTLRDFAQSEQQTEADYYTNRMKIARDAGVAAARAEEDHQRELRNLQEDHADRMNDLAGSRDALGMVREMRSAEKERRRAEETYQIEVSRKNQDLATTLADNEAQFATQREQRFTQFQQQLADEDAQKKIEDGRKAVDLAKQLTELDTQYRDEAKKRSINFGKQMTDLDTQFSIERDARARAFYTQMQDLAGPDGALQKERDLRNQFTGYMLDDLRAAVEGAKSGNYTLPSRDVGGYTNYGAYQMHPHEFVLTDKTTSKVEALAGRTLDQNTVLSLLAGGGRGQLQYIDQRRIDSRLSSEDRRMVNQDTVQILGDLVNGII